MEHLAQKRVAPTITCSRSAGFTAFMLITPRSADEESDDDAPFRQTYANLLMSEQICR